MITAHQDIPHITNPNFQEEESPVADETADRQLSKTDDKGRNQALCHGQVIGKRLQSSAGDRIESITGRHISLVRNAVSPICSVGSGSADPFSTLPSIARGDTNSLVYHWNTVFVHKTTPPGPRRKWFPLALENPALFHALMVISGADMFGSSKTRPSAAFFYHRGEVIRLVRKSILHPQTAASDDTIGSIACLLVTDSLSGHPERTQAHLAGLQQLIAIRGGMSELHPLVRRVVGWTDLLAAISLSQRPLLQQPQLAHLNYYSYYGPPSSSTTDFGLAFRARLFNFTGSQDLSGLAARMLWGLRNLSLLKETVHITDELVKDNISYSDRVEIFERETQKLLHDSASVANQDSNLEPTHQNLIFTLFALATLIHICNSFRDVPPTALTATVAHRLEIGMDISDANLNILLGTFPELMLWILFKGGSAAWGRSKIWFAKTASRILRVKKLDEKKDIAVAAESFIWPEGRENYDHSNADDVEIVDSSSASSDTMSSC